MGLIQEFEKKYWDTNTLVCGIDEAGRGPMAGPCVVAGVVFPKNFDHPLINDSKTLSETKRNNLRQIILKEALWYHIEIIDIEQIDAHNIYRATQMGMERISELTKDFMILTDAMPLTNGVKHQAIIKGDKKSISIAAASILAKTTRDDIMYEYDLMYPEYGFKQHKGYGTVKHREAIEKYGRCPIHRKSFKFKVKEQISFDI